MKPIRRFAMLVGGVSVGLLAVGGAAAATVPGAGEQAGAAIVAPAGGVQPVTVDTWYPWGTYATEAECVNAGNKYLEDQPWEFRAYWCQKQGIIWKLYLDEING